MLRRTNIYAIDAWIKRPRRFRARKRPCDCCQIGHGSASGGGSEQCRFAAPTARMTAMEDTTTTRTVSSTKPSTKPMSGFSGSAFEFPKFGMPNFEMPKMEIPAAFREFAEKGVSQAKE